jgi:hypothetical protein
MLVRGCCLARRCSPNPGACVRRDLDPHFGAISPDRGNHAIRVTRASRTYPGIQRSIRYLVRHLVCMWLCGRRGHLLPAVGCSFLWYSATGLRGTSRTPFRDELGDVGARHPFADGCLRRCRQPVACRAGRPSACRFSVQVQTGTPPPTALCGLPASLPWLQDGFYPRTEGE